MKSQGYRCLTKIFASRRLLLTGTPIQNNLLELLSLLTFVMPNVFRGSSEELLSFFARDNTCALDGTNNSDACSGGLLGKAKAIMEPFVLRRKKVDVLNDLPAKVLQVEYCPLEPSQQMAYTEMLESFRKSALDRATQKSSIARMSVCVQNTGALKNDLMQLRKLANHPLLHRIHYTDTMLMEMTPQIIKEPEHSDGDPELVLEDMGAMTDFELDRLCRNFPRTMSRFQLDDDAPCRSAKFFVLEPLLTKLKSQGSRVLLFSQFTEVLDILEVYLERIGYGCKGVGYLRLDGSTSVSERQTLIDKYQANPDIFIFLLTTKAGGVGINLTAANTVIFHDIDFNPQNDRQAEDRCHRVGQTKQVTIIRLIAKGTIDELMLKRATTKLQLDRDVSVERTESVEAALRSELYGL